MKRCALLILAAIAAAPAGAEDPAPDLSGKGPRDRALWEVGVIGAEFYLPDYPAAGQKHAKWVAAPFAIYRGRVLRADREGARARMVRGRCGIL